MAWEQLGVSIPHVAYATTGFALLLFGTISLFLKERLYIGEATVATIYGLIVGPHALNWFNPHEWGNVDYITLELSRIVLVVQIFAVAVELPKKYMLRHAVSVFMLLIPVMTYGWIVSSVFIWKLVPSLRWIEALCIAGCITATDPVLASAIVGKGKFAKRVPGHLRNLLSCESGCNDGLAFPFVYLALSVMRYEHHASKIAKHFILISLLYECVMGCVMGTVIGYLARVLIKFAEKHNFIDRESFLVYYFCLAVFCAGIGTITGVDDLLVAFSAGCAFSWDGWFAKQAEESEVSNAIDLLLNMGYFVYFGAIVPWDKFNAPEIGIKPWKLVILAIIVLLVRRIPIVLALKPLIPDIKTYREALFSGHFGPMGVGGLFMAILARAELETHNTTPLKELPAETEPHYYAIACIWPVTCFLVISSIVVHGSSIAVFTLGKRLNNFALTISYTHNNTQKTESLWMSRLPQRLSFYGANPVKLSKIETEEPSSARFLRRNRKGKRTIKHKRNKDKVPVALTVNIGGQQVEKTNYVDPALIKDNDPSTLKAYKSGAHIIFENKDGNVVHDFDTGVSHKEVCGTPELRIVEPTSQDDPLNKSDESIPKSSSSTSNAEVAPRLGVPVAHKGEHVYTYRIDDELIVENQEGEVISRYKIQHNHEPEPAPQRSQGLVGATLELMGLRAPQPRKAKDLEASALETLVPIDATHISKEEEHAIRENLKEIVRHNPNVEVSPTELVPSDSTSEGDDEGADETDEESDEETEVERHRRLSALGVIPVDHTQMPRPPPAQRSRAASRVPPPVIEEPEESSTPSRLTFELPKKQ